MRRYDQRRVAQLLSDTGTPIATQAEINDGSALAIFAANAVLIDLLKDASNKVLMACRVANRYRQQDLDLLYADTDRNSSLIRLVCDIAMGFLCTRRGLSTQEIYAQAPMLKDSLQTLEMLKTGDRVFDDAPPPGTDAPTAGAEVAQVAVNPIGLYWSVQTGNRIFPFCD